MEHAYKITLPNTQVVVYAESRGEAIQKYLKQTGMPEEFFKKHGVCKICTYSEAINTVPNYNDAYNAIRDKEVRDA